MSDTIAKRLVHPKGQAVEPEYENSSWSVGSLRFGSNFEDYDLDMAPISQWKPVPVLTTATDFELCHHLDWMLIQEKARKEAGPPPKKIFIRPRWNINTCVSDMCIALGKTHAQAQKSILKLRKFFQTQAFYKAQKMKEEREYRKMFSFAQKNRFCAPGFVEEKVLEQCSETYLKQNYKWRSSRYFYRHHPSTRTKVVVDNTLKRIACERNLRKKMEQAFMHDWRQERGLRRQRFHTLKKYEDCLDNWQKNAVILNWLEIDDILNYQTNFSWQMDSDAHGENSISKILQDADTIQEDNREVSSASSFQAGPDSYAAYASSYVASDESKSCDRWFTFSNFSWTSADNTNKTLVNISLPKFLIDTYPNAPNLMLFKQHVYWNGDMTVRVVINSNLRQYGQLQCRFYYGADKEYNFDKFKDNIYTGSQMPHCLISANSSNTGELNIPFEYIRPFLCVAKTTSGSADYASIGNLLISVVVPLTMAVGTESSCRVNLQIKFSNNNFNGQVWRGLTAQGPILETAMKTAFKFLNLDKPTNVQTGNVIVPQNVGSWAAGTGCDEWTVPLRLAPYSVLPYGPGRIPDLDEMSIKHVTSIYSIVKITNWTNSQHTGTLLDVFDATPTWKFDKYPKVPVDDRDCYVLPPVSVISNMFAYWRGTLSLRLDIVGAADLTGRLLVCYVPRVYSDAITITNAFSCPHAIFDLQEKRQFVYEIPFISDRMFWPRRNNMDRNHHTFIPPGKVFIFVYNDLIANATIPSDCHIVYYLAAGSDFEVSVPTQPSIALCYNTLIWLAKNTRFVCSFKQDYFPVYAGNWRSFGVSAKVILRYGPGSDHVAQVDVPTGSGEHLFKKVLIPLGRFYCPIIINNSKGKRIEVNAKYFVLFSSSQTTTPDYWYMIPFLTKEKATIFANNADAENCSRYAEDYIADPLDYSIPVQMQFTVADLNVDETNDIPSYQRYIGQMDERESAGVSLAPCARPSSTGSGMMIMGESFSDLKDIARRYQKYASGQVEVDPNKDQNFDSVQLRFPAMPQGLELDLGVSDNINEYWNRMREGPIPLIASGYRFFTGGLRFRVILTTIDDAGNLLASKLFVQHRPGFGGDLPVVNSVNFKNLTSADLEMPGFAYHIQNELTNSIISVEVPFYLPSIRGYLQRPQEYYASSLEHSLGEVVISCKIVDKRKFKYEYEIYYSLADDSRFSIFQGFPPMFPIYNIPDIVPTATRTKREIPSLPRIPIIPEEKEEREQEDPQPESKEPDFELFPPVRNSITEMEDLLLSLNCKQTIDTATIEILGSYYPGYSKEDDIRWFINYLKSFKSTDPNDVFLMKRFYLWYSYIRSHNIGRQYRDDPRFNEHFVLFYHYLYSTPVECIKVIPKLPQELKILYEDFADMFSYDELMKGQIGEAPTGQLFGIFNEVREAARGVTNLSDSVSKVNVNSVNETVNSVKQTADSLGNVSRSLEEGLTFVKQMWSDDDPEMEHGNEALERILSNLTSVVINISSFVINPGVITFCSSVMNILINLNIFKFNCVSNIYAKLLDLVKYLSKSTEPTEDFLHGQIDDASSLASYVSTLVAGVAGILNFSHSLVADKKRSLCKILIQDLKDFSMTSNHLFTFCKNNIEMLKTAIEYLFRSSPDICSLTFFEECDAEIFEWAKECLAILDGTQRETLFGNLVVASRVYDCANQASLIQLKLLDVKKRDKLVDLDSSKIKMLTDIIQRICKLRDELARAHIAPPVKFEPFVVHIFGAPGIGKSFVTQDLPFDLLESISYKSYNETTFVRTPGNAYWNGLCHQPVLIYDDWYQCTDPEFGGVQIAELLQLKTRAVFNPPMAHVDDKNIRYNPLIIFLVSNNGFPKYQGVENSVALYRRVDFLVHVKKVHQYRNTKVKNIPKEVKDNYSHLEFCVLDDVLNINQNYKHRQHIGFAAFKQRIIRTFKNYYRDELINYNIAIKRITRLYPDSPDEIFKLPKQQFWKSTQSYLEHVNKDDQEFNDKYVNLIKDFKDKKISSVRNLIRSVFNRFYGQIGEEESGETSSETIPKVVFSEKVIEQFNKVQDLNYASKNDKFEYEVSYQSPDIDYCQHGYPSCFHFNIARDIRDYNSEIEWISMYNQWKMKINCMAWDWDLIDPMIQEMFPSEFKWQDSGELIPDQRLHPKSVYFLSILLEEPYQVIDKIRLSQIIPFVELIVDLPDSVVYFYYPKSEILYYVFQNQEYLWFPHKRCAHRRCYFDLESRNRFVSFHIQNNQFLEAMMNNGEDISEEIPNEYLDSISGIPVFEEVVYEQISWLKGFWKKTCSKFTRPFIFKIFKWLSRLLWLFAIIAPIIQLIRVGNHIKKSATNFKIDEDKLYPWLAANRPDIIDSWKKDCQAQGFASGDNVHRGVKNSPRMIANKMLDFKGQMNTQEFESLQNCIMRNTFFLVQETEEGIDLVGRCLGIFGTAAIVPTHYIESFRNNSCKNFYYVPATCPVAIKCNFEDIKIVNYASCSLSAVKLPKNLGLFKDIRSRFASIYMHTKGNGVCTIIEVVKPSDRAVQCRSNIVSVIAELKPRIKALGDLSFRDFEIGDAYHYPYFTGKGCCGSMLIATNLPQGIVGMHVAGNRDSGVAEAVCREMVDQIYKIFGEHPEPIEPMLGQLGRNIPDTQVEVLGSVEPKFAHRENERSRIVPSLIQLRGSREDFPIYSDVAVLSPRDKRLETRFSPMQEGVKFHGMPLTSFCVSDMLEVEEDLMNLYLTKCRPARINPGKLTKLEACRGLEEVEGFEHLEWRTSEGYPFVALRPRGVHDKKWLFNFDGFNRCTSIHSDLLEVMKLKKSQRIANKIPFTVFTDCLKDTTVALEKVLKPGSTRVFSMAPVDFTIQQRQLTMDFSVAMMNNRLDLEHAVGINPDSVEWAELAGRLLSNGTKIVTGDFSKFGDTIPFEVIILFFNIISNWYSKFSSKNRERDNQQRKIMAFEIGRALHLIFDVIYRCICGQPSGNALTVLINSVANQWYMRCAWLEIMRLTVFAGLANFKKHVCMFAYGDDVILSVSDDVASYFNAESLHRFFGSHNLKFTNADKSDNIVPFTSLDEAEFLKRTFAIHPRVNRRNFGILLAPLHPKSIEDTVNWVWNSGYDFCDERSPGFREMCKQVCEDASRNAWTRGPEYYYDFCNKLKNFWSKQGEYVVYDSWDALDYKIFDLNLNINDYKGFTISKFV